MASHGITDPPTHPPIPWLGLARQTRPGVVVVVGGLQNLQTLYLLSFPLFSFFSFGLVFSVVPYVSICFTRTPYKHKRKTERTNSAPPKKRKTLITPKVKQTKSKFGGSATPSPSHHHLPTVAWPCEASPSPPIHIP